VSDAVNALGGLPEFEHNKLRVAPELGLQLFDAEPFIYLGDAAPQFLSVGGEPDAANP